MDVQNPATIEEAREMLLQNHKAMTELNNQLETLKTESTRKDETIEELRTHNQKLFLQLTQGEKNEPDDPDEPEETLEEFAKKLKGVI